MPTPYSRSSPMEVPSGFVTFLKNLWGIWVRIPTPSPVFPSASFPALCSRFSTILRAFSTLSRLFTPLMLTQAPIPQLSCSNSGLYKGAPGCVLFTSNMAFSPSLIIKLCLQDFPPAAVLSVRLYLLRCRIILPAMQGTCTTNAALFTGQLIVSKKRPQRARNPLLCDLLFNIQQFFSFVNNEYLYYCLIIRQFISSV